MGSLESIQSGLSDRISDLGSSLLGKREPSSISLRKVKTEPGASWFHSPVSSSPRLLDFSLSPGQQDPLASLLSPSYAPSSCGQPLRLCTDGENEPTALGRHFLRTLRTAGMCGSELIQAGWLFGIFAASHIRVLSPDSRKQEIGT